MKRITLYLIEILHQTTTRTVISCLIFSLYLIEILHQTTTVRLAVDCLDRCILSKFYIKPQHDDVVAVLDEVLYLIEILHQTTTILCVCIAIIVLYLIEILHQTTTD